MSLQNKIEEIVGRSNATFGVAVKHLETGEEAVINGDMLFQQASVFKIPILVKLLKDVETNQIRLDSRVTMVKEDRVPGSGILQELDSGLDVTVKDLALLMIIVSDNFATDKLLHMIGIDHVHQYMESIGLTETSIKHSCYDLLRISVGIGEGASYDDVLLQLKNGEYDHDSVVFERSTNASVSTAKEMNLLLEKLLNQELLNETYTNVMVDILLKQRIQNRLPALLPEGTKIAHKTGTLDHYLNDCGIVFLPEEKGTFVISVFSSHHSSSKEGDQAIAEISEAAYTYFMTT
ncbi:class A beta-lactamase-related serine hydrolase [Alkalihalobacillus sp. MEB130]|uniref:serine hydrolase n=1 Tax=Alkalihalobacillus sp. MEB130 TaxID=2976704 RepID=UPI0028DDABC7|nr:serine hydrolase [Alkalihalobacillus sp. MEB130]MDT8861888.1 class A beta-lactamase-related serine hydrolase [Alkalihalobacillus sp. MEB130]